MEQPGSIGIRVSSAKSPSNPRFIYNKPVKYINFIIILSESTLVVSVIGKFL